MVPNIIVMNTRAMAVKTRIARVIYGASRGVIWRRRVT